MICDSMDSVDGTSGPESSSAIIGGHTPTEDSQSISISLYTTICGNKYFVVTKSDIVKVRRMISTTTKNQHDGAYVRHDSFNDIGLLRLVYSNGNSILFWTSDHPGPTR